MENKKEISKENEQTNPGMVISVFGFLIILISKYVNNKFDEIFISSGILTIVFGLFIYITLYLRNTKFKLNPNKSLNNDLSADLQTELAKIKESLENRVEKFEGVLDEKNKNEITDTIIRNLEKYLSREIVESIENSKNNSRLELIKKSYIRRLSNETRRRLQEEVYSLSNRSNLNLAIGIITTLLASILLVYFLFFNVENSMDLNIILSYYIPRISTILFIEIFSFFFLNLYKSSLNEIKYFQNELTNFESKNIAIEVSLLSEDNEVIGKTIDELLKTERNFKLLQGESTVDLEKIKYEKYSEEKLYGIIGNILEKFKMK